MRNKTYLVLLVTVPLLVIAIFVLLVQNSYLKGTNDERRDQIEKLQKTIDDQKGQLDEIQRKQDENSNKIDQLDADGNPIIVPGGGGTTTRPGNQSVTVNPQPGNPTPPQSNNPPANNPPANQPPVVVYPPRPNPDTNPTLLCNPLLPLICG